MVVRVPSALGLLFRTALGWLFRDRQTGRIVIVQFPNIPLVVWIFATSLRWPGRGHIDKTLGVIAALALVVWSGDEVIRGVNPWRRFLGAVVLGGLIARVAMTA